MPNVSWCLDTELASCFSSVRQPGQSPSDADVQQDASPVVTQGGAGAALAGSCLGTGMQCLNGSAALCPGEADPLLMGMMQLQAASAVHHCEHGETGLESAERLGCTVVIKGSKSGC